MNQPMTIEARAKILILKSLATLGRGVDLLGDVSGDDEHGPELQAIVDRLIELTEGW